MATMPSVTAISNSAMDPADQRHQRGLGVRVSGRHHVHPIFICSNGPS